MQKQIIAFIDPSKFAALLGNSLPYNYRQNGNFLDNGNNLVYIESDGVCEVATYNVDKAKTASIILVSDTFNLQYTPDAPFKLVKHGKTPDDRISRLSSDDNFRGWEKSQEEEKIGDEITPYKYIADFINKIQGVTFDGIYNEIGDFDKKLEDLLQPFARANPYEPTNENGEDLKEAKEALNKYIKSKL